MKQSQPPSAPSAGVPDSPLTTALNWEFNLWKEAEKARFRAEMLKMRGKREEALRRQFNAQKQQLLDQKQTKAGEVSDLVLQIQQTIAQTSEKTAQQIQTQQQIRNQINGVKNSLKQTLLESESQLAAALAEAEQMYQTEAAKAEQMTAQAAFFQGEIGQCEAKRKQEAIDFMRFLEQQKEAKNQEIQLAEAGQRARLLKEKESSLLTDIQRTEWQLEEKMRSIRGLQRILLARDEEE